MSQFQIEASHFDGLVTTILGYILLAGALIVFHVSIYENVHVVRVICFYSLC